MRTRYRDLDHLHQFQVLLESDLRALLLEELKMQGGMTAELVVDLVASYLDEDHTAAEAARARPERRGFIC